MEVIDLDTGMPWPERLPVLELVPVPTMFVVAVVSPTEHGEPGTLVRRFVVLAKDRDDAARIVVGERVVERLDRVLVDEAKAVCVAVGTQVVPTVLINPWLAECTPFVVDRPAPEQRAG